MPANIVINVWANEPDFTPLDEPNPDVQTIIIGESPTNSSATETAVQRLPLFETDFKKMTHLFLWNTTGLDRIPSLAAQQQVLELRSAADLTTIDSLPSTLQSLVIEDCPKLTNLPSLEGKNYPDLIELSLAGCDAIDPDWIHRLISVAPNLRHIDLSRCTQVQRLPPDLPRKLDRLELNGCTGLQDLPSDLPLTLRRLGLRHATSITSVPKLKKDIDYVDLAYTKLLTRLPQFPELDRKPKAELVAIKPRTLFLFGSGVLEPPASEHGSTDEANVALETREYQDEVDLVGRGTVSRCKLLLLGNGEAGKTKLALNLNPHFRKENRKDGGDYDGTTHGVRFWDWPDYKTKTRKVNLHMWDFGGQEIYHSTHRVFVSRGSVFVVLWNPAQDGAEPQEKAGYQDIWYPVRYWLDYIHMECPHNQPLIAIVCSRQADRWASDSDANQQVKSELKAKLRRDIGDEYSDRCPLFVLDSEKDIGERTELEDWLNKSVSTVVETQGTIVPTYWEIAQNMVEQWLPDPIPSDVSNDPSPSAAHTRMMISEFTEHLRNAISAELQKKRDDKTDFDKLRNEYGDGAFLTDRRVERTLRFLTHSGWLYYSSSFDSRVIIDQPWALEQIYCALDRRGESSVYKKLTANKGQFTFKNLQEWYWKNEPIDQDDQELLLSFMTAVGVCFPLTNNRYYGGSSIETVYISPTHLPDSGDLTQEFASKHGNTTQESVESPQLHRGHWFSILRELCKRYGDQSTYTKDACLIHGSSYRWDREDNRWSALLRFQLNDEKKGLGGKVLINATGPQLAEKLPSLKGFVESFLPGFDGKASDAVREFDHDFRECVEDAPTVFFSFAWDPVGKEGEYEEAVDAVENALMPFHDRGQIQVLRDKRSMQPGDYISEFVAKVGSQDVDLVLVFTSDKYWKSWWCMLEFASLLQSLNRENRGIEKSVLVITHESGNKWTAGDIAPLVTHWKNLPLVTIDDDQYPVNLPEQLLDLNWKNQVKRFVNVITDASRPLTSDAPGLRKEWKPEDADEIINWVKQKLRLPTDL